MKKRQTIIGIAFLIILIGVTTFVATNKNSTDTAHQIYSVKSNNDHTIYSANTPSTYSFTIVDTKGNVVKDFAITHTKLMHLIVVRKDLAYFQHVHPEIDPSTGVFTLKDLIFPTDGKYRIYADFALEKSPTDHMGMIASAKPTPFEDISIGDQTNYKIQSIGTEEKTKTFDGVSVTLTTHGPPTKGSESMLMFNLSQNGKPITDLQPYLGELGHTVVIQEDTLQFIHEHPMESINAKQTGNVDFMIDFPEAGKYKIFTQFQRNKKVITADFVVTVTADQN